MAKKSFKQFIAVLICIALLATGQGELHAISYGTTFHDQAACLNAQALSARSLSPRLRSETDHFPFWTDFAHKPNFQKISVHRWSLVWPKFIISIVILAHAGAVVGRSQTPAETPISEVESSGTSEKDLKLTLHYMGYKTKQEFLVDFNGRIQAYRQGKVDSQKIAGSKNATPQQRSGKAITDRSIDHYLSQTVRLMILILGVDAHILDGITIPGPMKAAYNGDIGNEIRAELGHLPLVPLSSDIPTEIPSLESTKPAPSPTLPGGKSPLPHSINDSNAGIKNGRHFLPQVAQSADSSDSLKENNAGAVAVAGLQASILPKELRAARDTLDRHLAILIQRKDAASSATMYADLKPAIAKALLADRLYTAFKVQPDAVPEEIRVDFVEMDRLIETMVAELKTVEKQVQVNTVDARHASSLSFAEQRELIKLFSHASKEWAKIIEESVPVAIKPGDTYTSVWSGDSFQISMMMVRDAAGAFHISELTDHFVGTFSPTLHRRLYHLRIDAGRGITTVHEALDQEVKFHTSARGGKIRPVPVGPEVPFVDPDLQADHSPNIKPAPTVDNPPAAAAARFGALSRLASLSAILAFVPPVISGAIMVPAQRTVQPVLDSWYFGLPYITPFVLAGVGAATTLIFVLVVGIPWLYPSIIYTQSAGLRKKIARDKLAPPFQQLDRAADRASDPTDVLGAEAFRMAIVAIRNFDPSATGPRRWPDKVFDWDRINKLFDGDFVLADRYYEAIHAVAGREFSRDPDPLHSPTIARHVLAMRDALDRGEEISAEAMRTVIESALPSQLRGIAVTLLGERAAGRPDASFVWHSQLSADFSAERRALVLNLLSQTAARSKDRAAVHKAMRWLSNVDPLFAKEVEIRILAAKRARQSRPIRFLHQLLSRIGIAAGLFITALLQGESAITPILSDYEQEIAAGLSSDKSVDVDSLRKELRSLLARQDQLNRSINPVGKLGPVGESARLRDRQRVLEEKERVLREMVNIMMRVPNPHVLLKGLNGLPWKAYNERMKEQRPRNSKAPTGLKFQKHNGLAASA